MSPEGKDSNSWQTKLVSVTWSEIMSAKELI